jgi:hypothetical protein
VHFQSAKGGEFSTGADKAEADGTDAPQAFIPIERSLELMFGPGGGPDDLPPELRQAHFEYYRKQRSQGFIATEPPAEAA